MDKKGLLIPDESFAKRALTDIGYFSLIGGYKGVFTNPMTRRYDIPTTFDDILLLYQFDENLRQLTFGYLNKIEQKVQNLISDSFCSTYGERQSCYLSASDRGYACSLMGFHVDNERRNLRCSSRPD